MEATDQMIRKDIEQIRWVLWPKSVLTAEEIQLAIKQHLNHPWKLKEVEVQLDAMVRSGKCVKTSATPAHVQLGALIFVRSAQHDQIQNRQPETLTYRAEGG